MKQLILFMAFLVSPSAGAAGLLCEHAIYGAPFASVELEELPGGTLGLYAKVSMYGKSREESVTQEKAGEGELYHLWLSQENPNNAIEMMVYEGEEMRSKLVNPRFGWGREIAGICRRVKP